VLEERLLREPLGVGRKEGIFKNSLFHIGEVHNFYSSPNLFRVSRSGRMR
jgi:hypothetical protein